MKTEIKMYRVKDGIDYCANGKCYPFCFEAHKDEDLHPDFLKRIVTGRYVGGPCDHNHDREPDLILTYES